MLKNGSVEMLKKSERSQGFFTPLPTGPTPNTTQPKQVIRHYRKAQGRFGGTGFCPLLSIDYAFLLITVKISPEPKKSENNYPTSTLLHSLNTEQHLQTVWVMTKPITQNRPFFHYEGPETHHSCDHRPEARYCLMNLITVEK